MNPSPFPGAQSQETICPDCRRAGLQCTFRRAKLLPAPALLRSRGQALCSPRRPHLQKWMGVRRSDSALKREPLPSPCSSAVLKLIIHFARRSFLPFSTLSWFLRPGKSSAVIRFSLELAMFQQLYLRRRSFCFLSPWLFLNSSISTNIYSSVSLAWSLRARPWSQTAWLQIPAPPPAPCVITNPLTSSLRPTCLLC